MVKLTLGPRGRNLRARWVRHLSAPSAFADCERGSLHHCHHRSIERKITHHLYRLCSA